MIEGLKRYERYKPTGLDWLESIPSHWSVRRIKSLMREVDRRTSTGSEPLLSLRMNVGLVDHHTHGGKDIDPSALIGYKVVQPGQIVMNRMRASLGLFAEAQSKGLVSPDYAMFEVAAGFVPSYAVSLFQTPGMRAIFRLESTGLGTGESGFLRLYSDQFGRLSIPVPPTDEQQAIVRFLTWAHGRLDRAIRAKRKVIALLNEQKQAIIHRAVTRGLDPDVPMKPSGVNGLGDIPQHWEVRPLKAVCAIQSGVTLGKDYGGQVTISYPYLRVANVQTGQVNLRAVKTINLPRAEAMRCLLQNGDVLMTEGGDPDKLGRGCVWHGQIAPCLHQNHVFAVRPDPSRMASSYLAALLGTTYARGYFESTAKQTTNLASTNKTKIGQFPVLLPDLDEQKRLMMDLEAQLLPIASLILQRESEIDLLAEYRTRLAADIVTGQLDVREAAARLPDEAAPDLSDTRIDDEPDGDDDIDETADEGETVS